MRNIVDLTAEAVKGIKGDLWNGARQKEVAEKYRVTQATISRIMTGKLHPHIPWPDGSLVQMSGHQRTRIYEARYMGSELKPATNLPQAVIDDMKTSIGKVRAEKAEERTKDFKNIFPDWK